MVKISKEIQKLMQEEAKHPESFDQKQWETLGHSAVDQLVPPGRVDAWLNQPLEPGMTLPLRYKLLVAEANIERMGGHSRLIAELRGTPIPDATWH